MVDFFTWPPPAHTFLNIFVMDLTTGQSRQITSGSYHDYRPSFSPDGSRIVFSSDRGGQMQLWSVPTQGQAEPHRMQEEGWGMRPWYSRDGTTVFFHTDVGGRHRICRMDARGGEFVRLSNDDRGMSHGVFALQDEDCLLMHSSRDGGCAIWRLPLDGAEPTRIETRGFSVAAHATQAKTGVMTFDSTQDLPTAESP